MLSKRLKMTCSYFSAFPNSKPGAIQPERWFSRYWFFPFWQEGADVIDDVVTPTATKAVQWTAAPTLNHVGGGGDVIGAIAGGW